MDLNKLELLTLRIALQNLMDKLEAEEPAEDHDNVDRLLGRITDAITVEETR